MTHIFFTYGMVLWCIFFFFFLLRLRLFKIHWIILYPVGTMVSLTLMDWMVIYPMNSAIQLLNNWGQSNLVSDIGYSDFLFLEKTGLKVLFFRF